MNPAVLILSSLGGIVSFVTGVFFIVRAIFKNVNATKENTDALQGVEVQLKDLRSTVDSHTVEIAILKDRQRR